MDALANLNLDLNGQLFVVGSLPGDMKDRFMLRWLHSKVSEIANTATELMQAEDLSQVTKRSLQTFASALRASVSLEMSLEQTKAVLVSFEALSTRTRLSDWPARGSVEETARDLFDTESLTIVDLDLDEVLRAALAEGGEAGALVEDLAAAYHRGKKVSDVPAGAVMIGSMPRSDLERAMTTELAAGPGLAGRLAAAS